jgi:hypothetical protein
MIDEVDVEIAWSMRGICIEASSWRSSSSSSSAAANARDVEYDCRTTWTDTIDALVGGRRRRQLGRRRCEGRASGGGEGTSSSRNDSSSNGALTDEVMMMQTIHSILDGRGRGGGGGSVVVPSSASSSSDRDHDVDDDWILQYDIAVLSCLQSHLRRAIIVDVDDDDGKVEGEGRRTRMPKWTSNTILELIRWSQQRRHRGGQLRPSLDLSTEVYIIVLQYLHLSLIGFAGKTMTQLYSHYSSSPRRKGSIDGAIDDSHVACRPDDDGGADDFAIALRSFIFHGLLTQTDDVGRKSMSLAVSNGKSDVSSMRGDIYSLVVKLWRHIGIDWLFVPELTTTALDDASDWWWFPSTGDKIGVGRSTLGPTWPLCTLVRMAAGEYRIGLGRLITAFEDVSDSAASSLVGCGASSLSCLVYEVNCCARIITEAVHLMTEIADDGAEAGSHLITWTPDAILHVRNSLEDALNSSVQYCNALLFDHGVHTIPRPDTNIPATERDQVGQTCCLVMGTIAAELEVDQLLAPHSADTRTTSDRTRDDETKYSSFACALRGGILFCHSLGERRHGTSSNALGQRSHEYDEPLTYLLPCVMSIVSKSLSYQGEGQSNPGDALDFAIDSLRKDDCLMLAMSGFLYRTSCRWRNVCEGIGPSSLIDESMNQMTDSAMSTLKLSILIIIEFTSIPTSSINFDQMPLLRLEGGTLLQPSLDQWRTNLAQIGEWHCKNLRNNAASALDLLSQCLAMTQ